ncbi:MAG: 1,4-alpha-glucan branching enzyme, partial [Nitrospirota bacterium]
MKDLKKQIKLIINADHWDPFQLLGIHIIDLEGKKVAAVRAFLPEAERASVLDLKTMKSYQMAKIHKAGFFEVLIGDRKEVFPYRISVKSLDGTKSEFYEPYSFLPVLTDFDLHLMGEGSHYRQYEKLGAHLMEIKGIKGVHFAVWAPNAKRVSVIGNFNKWDGRRHPMR